MKILCAVRSFHDYRVPVFKSLREICSEFTFLFPPQYTPKSAIERAKDELGDSAVELSSEFGMGSKKPSNKMANKGFSFSYSKDLKKELKSREFDVMLGEGFFQWTVPLLFHRFWKKKPLAIFYERTHHTERSAQFYRRWYRKLAMRWIGGICCNGILSHDYLVNIGFPEKKITTGFASIDSTNLMNAYGSVSDEELTSLRQKLQLNSQRVVLYIGQLIHRKGVLELLNTWNGLEASVKRGHVLVMIGNGSLKDECEAIVQGHDDVRFVEEVPYEEIPSYFKLSSFFVMPTLEDNWSMVVPEAMAVGKPVLCSKYNGGAPELVKESSNGFVYDPLQSDDAASAFTKMMTASDSTLTEMGMRSKEIIQKFTPANSAESLRKACEYAIQSLPASRK